MVIIAGCIQLAHAEQIPDSTKSRIESWALRGGSDEQFAQALHDLSEYGAIKSKIRQNTAYSLPSYGQTAFVEITGKTGNHSQTSPVSLTVVAPDGTASEYTVPVLESGSYHTVVPILHDSPKGTYKVIAHHAGKKLEDSFFYVEYPSATIPRWVANTAKWWLDGRITDGDFFSGLDFLLDNRIIRVAVFDADQSVLEVSVDGHKTVRRGAAQDISIHVEDLQGPVGGATVFIRVEDYDEDIFEEFEGFTDSDGNYEISWELSKDFDNLKKFLVYVDVTDGLSSSSRLFTFEVYCLCGEPNCKCRT